MSGGDNYLVSSADNQVPQDVFQQWRLDLHQKYGIQFVKNEGVLSLDLSLFFSWGKVHGIWFQAPVESAPV